MKSTEPREEPEEPDKPEAAPTAPSPVPVSPSLDAALAGSAPTEHARFEDSRRLALISLVSVGVAIVTGLAAQFFIALIGFITNLAFYGRWSLEFVSPAGNTLGAGVIVVTVTGGLIVGLMARFGSKAIRGHGIPEAMEQVLLNQSRIPARVSILKPLSAAIAIGTGGPFGAEGPIIATGGAIGSLGGQLLRITADERKTLLAAGAAAGMAATFGSPVSAVLLAVELLLFEYSSRTLIPVSIAAAAATGVRIAFHGTEPIFAMEAVSTVTEPALVAYVVLGALSGLLAALIVRLLYAVETAYERTPIHWMWWPAIGAVAVGIIGWIAPNTLGVGYGNIDGAISGQLAGGALLTLMTLKLLSWVIALGSGTSGGTLAPLFTIGSAFGALIGGLVAHWLPGLGVHPDVAALVGMAAVFTGASHALLASVVFAFETTRQPLGLLPLLAGCAAAYLVALTVARTSIMTEKLARRGRFLQPEFELDQLRLTRIREVMTTEVVTLRAAMGVEDVRDAMATGDPDYQHQGFPVLDADERLVGVVTRRDLLAIDLPYTATVGDLLRRPPVFVYDDATGREAVDHMLREGVGRLPVVSRKTRTTVVGMVTRSDLLEAYAVRLSATRTMERLLPLTWRPPTRQRPASSPRHS
jgi:chloride channel protein, CIC family